MTQEAGSHQTPRLPAPGSWTCSLQNVKKNFLFISQPPPSCPVCDYSSLSGLGQAAPPPRQRPPRLAVSEVVPLLLLP